MSATIITTGTLETGGTENVLGSAARVASFVASGVYKIYKDDTKIIFIRDLL